MSPSPKNTDVSTVTRSKTNMKRSLSISAMKFIDGDQAVLGMPDIQAGDEVLSAELLCRCALQARLCRR